MTNDFVSDHVTFSDANESASDNTTMKKIRNHEKWIRTSMPRRRATPIDRANLSADASVHWARRRLRATTAQEGHDGSVRSPLAEVDVGEEQRTVPGATEGQCVGNNLVLVVDHRDELSVRHARYRGNLFVSSEAGLHS